MSPYLQNDLVEMEGIYDSDRETYIKETYVIVYIEYIYSYHIC